MRRSTDESILYFGIGLPRIAQGPMVQRNCQHVDGAPLAYRSKYGRRADLQQIMNLPTIEGERGQLRQPAPDNQHRWDADGLLRRTAAISCWGGPDRAKLRRSR
jgi:hypothetical protein